MIALKHLGLGVLAAVLIGSLLATPAEGIFFSPFFCASAAARSARFPAAENPMTATLSPEASTTPPLLLPPPQQDQLRTLYTVPFLLAKCRLSSCSFPVPPPRGIDRRLLLTDPQLNVLYPYSGCAAASCSNSAAELNWSKIAFASVDVRGDPDFLCCQQQR